jgi:hypothetical protein
LASLNSLVGAGAVIVAGALGLKLLGKHGPGSALAATGSGLGNAAGNTGNAIGQTFSAFGSALRGTNHGDTFDSTVNPGLFQGGSAVDPSNQQVIAASQGHPDIENVVVCPSGTNYFQDAQGFLWPWIGDRFSGHLGDGPPLPPGAPC